jgi:hypothetical protein
LPYHVCPLGKRTIGESERLFSVTNACKHLQANIRFIIVGLYNHTFDIIAEICEQAASDVRESTSNLVGRKLSLRAHAWTITLPAFTEIVNHIFFIPAGITTVAAHRSLIAVKGVIKASPFVSRAGR